LRPAFEDKFKTRFIMKRFAVVATICASFLLGGAISAFAQDEHRDDKEVRQEEKHDQHEARRIPDEHVAVRHVTVVNGERRFAYGGYNFAFAEPWPAGWAYTDDCYIDFVDGGYYLFNLKHPGVRIAVTVLP
jgi:hypothetical protein